MLTSPSKFTPSVLQWPSVGCYISYLFSQFHFQVRTSSQVLKLAGISVIIPSAFQLKFSYYRPAKAEFEKQTNSDDFSYIISRMFSFLSGEE